MAQFKCKNVKISGIKTVVPQNYIDIDDEIEYFDNNPKKLARAKKMMGYGRRYIADDNTTVCDMAVDAAEKLISEMKINKDEIDLLIFVNQKPDYKEPCDACVAHGLLDLSENCTTLDINLGCSGYIHALMTAHAYLSTGIYKKCLLLAGDLCGGSIKQTDRKKAPVFGDAVSASILEYTDEENEAFFVTGTNGKGWNKIVYPFGGTRLPFNKENIEEFVTSENGTWYFNQSILKGEDVFNFTIDVAPKLIKDTMTFANLTADDVDMFAIHQANKQIVQNIVSLADIPAEKAPTETFSKYANNSTNSVVTVLCDQGHNASLKRVVLCAFGIGLSWGAVALNVENMYNGGISTYFPPQDKLTKEEQISYWIKYYKGEE